MREINSEKYYVNTCQGEIDRRGTTANWIDIVRAFKKVSNPRDIDIQKSQILQAVIEDGREKVVKVGANDVIEHEYNIAHALSRVKGFVKFICYFTCNDDFYKYFRKDSGNLCDGPGTSMKIILMPYFPEGSLGKHTWTADNIDVLRSCINMACLSLCEAFERKQIVHGDFHPENVMLKKTKQTTLEFDGIVVKTYGYRTWIMDFEASYQFNETTRDWKAKTDFFYDMKKFFILLPSFVPSIDKTGINAIVKFIYASENGELDKALMYETINSNIMI